MRGKPTRYFGKVCALHPELKGERLKSCSHCVRCHRVTIAPAKVRQQTRKQRNAKQAVLDHYGNCCKRCGIDDPDVLTIDHIKQDGAVHRRSISKGSINGQRMYKWLVSNGFPRGFRLLCFNCNIKVYRLHRRRLGHER